MLAESSPQDLLGHLDGLRTAASEVDRPAYLGRLEINFMQVNPVEVNADTAQRYARLGVDRLLVYPLPLENPAQVGAFLERHADLPR